MSRYRAFLFVSSFAFSVLIQCETLRQCVSKCRICQKKVGWQPSDRFYFHRNQIVRISGNCKLPSVREDFSR